MPGEDNRLAFFVCGETGTSSRKRELEKKTGEIVKAHESKFHEIT